MGVRAISCIATPVAGVGVGGVLSGWGVLGLGWGVGCVGVFNRNSGSFQETTNTVCIIRMILYEVNINLAF